MRVSKPPIMKTEISNPQANLKMANRTESCRLFMKMVTKNHWENIFLSLNRLIMGILYCCIFWVMEKGLGCG